jgi:hypothetical protein
MDSGDRGQGSGASQRPLTCDPTSLVVRVRSEVPHGGFMLVPPSGVADGTARVVGGPDPWPPALGPASCPGGRR